MYVCHCRAITDRMIRDHIDRGVLDESELAACSGAGVRCGGCIPALRRLLTECDPRGAATNQRTPAGV